MMVGSRKVQGKESFPSFDYMLRNERSRAFIGSDLRVALHILIKASIAGVEVGRIRVGGI